MSDIPVPALTDPAVQEARNGFNKKGAGRRKSYTVEKVSTKAETILSEGVLEIVANSARTAGCTVKAIVRCSREPYVLKKTLFINGKRCDVHVTTRGFHPKGCKRVYAPVRLQDWVIEKADAVIAYVAIDGLDTHLFVIPTAVLREMPVRSIRQGKRFYFPLERLPVYQNTHSLIDYWQYEDAWHLLSPQ